VLLLESGRVRSGDDLAAAGRLMALVLVVDDEEPIRDILREALESGGHRVMTASDGREALRLYNAHRPDVVVTDIVMPRRSGIDLVLELSRISPPPKVIAISGVTGKAFLDAAREANVARTFVKPFDVMEVVRVVTQLAGA
jgi:two-component system, response regulator, stage 0 sporulation protein F